ncbi:MAG: type I-E CRISPR-associated endonuclease Cas1 [Dehalococcoidia bacterium]|nr:type I-E CRISPR-associated endonuclease Cas1 [Dehalococcoidia bacterium]
MRTLLELPRFQDRWSYLYLEMGRLDVDSLGLCFRQGERATPVPIDQLAVVMLGPGTTVTHAAVAALSRNNCLVAWTGQDGVRLYAASTGGTYSARRLIRQAVLVSDEQSRLAVAWRMYRFRFNETVPEVVSLESIRGMEGLRVRKAYADASLKHGVEWKGRKYDQGNWNAADPINRALSCANACLYGVCHAAILSAGYSPGLGFVHTGKMLSFVYDVADLYKTQLTIPVAFQVVSEAPHDIERAVRMRCRTAFYEFKVMERIIPDIAEVLGAGDDDGESPDEFEGRIVTLAPGTGDWDLPWESERAGQGRVVGEGNESGEADRLGTTGMVG